MSERRNEISESGHMPEPPQEIKRMYQVGEEAYVVKLAGVLIKSGDRCIVWTSYRNPPEELVFRSFNRHLFLFHFEDSDGNIHLIPYKQIKRIRISRQQ